MGLTYCDDGNFVNGDGCDSECQIEPGFQADGTNVDGRTILVDV